MECADFGSVDLLYFVHKLLDVSEGLVEKGAGLLHGEQIERDLLIAHLDHFLLYKIKAYFLRIDSVSIQGRCIVANFCKIQVKQTVLRSFLAT